MPAPQPDPALLVLERSDEPLVGAAAGSAGHRPARGRRVAGAPGGAAAVSRRWRRRLFGAAAVVAALTYFNFGAFHFGNFVHTWDTLHYYLGAKYFHELSYDRLYECMAVADAEEPGWRGGWRRRKITNLRTNVLEPAAEILAHPERCTAHFSPQRWRQFTADVAYFRDREAPQRWEDISTDHGFNGTPVWLLAGSPLANLAPASDRQILGLTLLDPLYFLALAAVIGWAFGVRPLAVALLVLATFFPSRFFWTGGAFLRWDWLFYTVAAVACLKKGRPWLGGMALGYAAMLRVFPGLLAAGPAAAVVALALRHGPRAACETAGGPRPPALPRRRRPGGGAPGGGEPGAAGGPGAYRAFVANTRKHQATPLTNHMGLRTVVAYRPAEVGRHAGRRRSGADPWLRWKEARLAAWQQARPLAALPGRGGALPPRPRGPPPAGALDRGGAGHALDRLRGRAHLVLLRVHPGAGAAVDGEAGGRHRPARAGGLLAAGVARPAPGDADLARRAVHADLARHPARLRGDPDRVQPRPSDGKAAVRRNPHGRRSHRPRRLSWPQVLKVSSVLHRQRRLVEKVVVLLRQTRCACRSPAG